MNNDLPDKPSRRAMEILAWMTDRARETAVVPGTRQICAEFGLNPATVHHHLKVLEKAGLVDLSPVWPQGRGEIRIVGARMITPEVTL